MFRVIQTTPIAVRDAQHDAEIDRNHRWCAWIHRIAKGDIDALSALYDESSTALFGLVLQIVSDRQSAEDILVDLYLHIRQQAGTFAPRRQKAMDWLIAIARDFTVERARRQAMVVSKPAAESFQDERRLAGIAMAQLPVEQRSILEMTYFGGLSAAEVAGLLGLSREYVAKQIVFGMRKLKRCSENLAGATIRITRSG